MKKLLMLFVLALTLFGATSCSTLYDRATSNLNQNLTNVVLQNSDYKVVDKVRGEAEAKYILIFGGGRTQGLIQEARAEMLESANLVGSSKAVINETVEYSVKTVLGFVNTVKVTVTGYVVEFTE